MRSILLAVLLSTPFASATFVFGDHCTNSDSCPKGASCVQGYCFDCTLDPVKCLRSVEVCDKLKCASDESCYLRQEVDYTSNTATVTTVCSKTDPCSHMSCPNGCSSVTYGDQPPSGKCVDKPDAPSSPCDNHKCPDGYKCFVKSSFAFGLPGKKEAACADTSACDKCDFFQYCDLREQSDGTIKGVCVGHFKFFS